MRIVITGGAGRLAGVLGLELASAGHEVRALDRSDLDVTRGADVVAALERLGPDAIVNCSAYNAVDGAESDRAAAFAVNAEGPANLARAAAATGSLLIHYSTDFVFDGAAVVPYDETSATIPLSAYGASKLAGECEVRRLPRHYILRVASVFGGEGVRGHRATIDQIAERVIAGTVVRAATDRTVSPSYVVDVSRATRALIERDVPHGTYHCVNSGYATWYELALEVSRHFGLPAEIVPLKSAEMAGAALRPLFCGLSNGKLRAAGIEMPTWQSALQRHLSERYQQVSAGTDRVRRA
jgi:dTDP-4-dehydrorhamnose reductase